MCCRLFSDISVKIWICNALLGAIATIEFISHVGDIFTMQHEFYIGFCATLTAQTIGTIISGIGGVFEGFVGYFDFVLDLVIYVM